MPFPSSDEVQSLLRGVKLQSLEQQIHRIDPSIMLGSDGPSNVLMTSVPPGRAVVGLFRFPAWMGWGVMASNGRPPIYWPLDADAADVAQCFVGRLEESRGGVMPSPWRWGEGVRSVAVELADRLVDLGFDVAFVADANRTVPRGSDVRQVSTDLGPVVRFTMGAFAAMYSERPLVGWALDVEWNGRALRLPLEPLPEGRGPEAEPVHRMAEQLAGAAVRALLESDGETEKRALDLAMLDESPGSAEAAAWMRRCGLPAELSRLDGGGTGVEAPGLSVIIHRSSRPVGAPAIQAGFGVAVVEGRTPMVFSASGYTRDAVRWAQQAGIALWTMRGPGWPPAAVTTLSKGLKPVVVESDCGKGDVEDL